MHYLNKLIRISLLLSFITLISCMRHSGSESDVAQQTRWNFYEKKTVESLNHNNDSAWYYATRMHREAEKANDSVGIARSNFMMGHLKNLDAAFDSGLVYLLKAKNEIAYIRDTLTKLRVYFNLGKCYYDNGAFDDAEESFNMALSLALGIGDSLQIAAGYSALGMIHRDLHDLKKATEYTVKALSIAEKTGDTDIVAASYRDLAVVADQSGNSEYALKNLKLALALSTAIGDIRQIAELYQEFAIFYFESNNDSSLFYFNKAYVIFKSLRDEEMMTVVTYNKANILFDHGKYRESKDIFMDIYWKSVKRNDIEGQAKSISMLITSCIKLHEIEVIKEYLALAEKLALTYRHPDFNAEILRSRIDWLVLQKRETAAIPLYEKYLQMKDSLNDSKNKDIVQSISSQFDNEKKKYEYSSLLKKNEIQHIRVRIQNILIISMIIFIIVAIVLISVIVVSLRKNIKTKQKLAISETQLLETIASKDKFFSIIAHDLKNPFQTIFGYTDLLTAEIDGLTKDQVSRYVTYIGDSSKHAYTLLENLLVWAQTQNKTIQYRPEILELREFAEENIRLLQSQAIAKMITVHSTIDQPLTGRFDSNMINTILRNLVSNAIKFTPSGGRVEVSAVKREGMLVISVTDTGVGIEPERIGRIFDLSAMETTRGTSNEKGTGLGLILCKEFAEMHGGRIWVESVIGRGSVFTFSIPAA